MNQRVCKALRKEYREEINSVEDNGYVRLPNGQIVSPRKRIWRRVKKAYLNTKGNS